VSDTVTYIYWGSYLYGILLKQWGVSEQNSYYIIQFKTFSSTHSLPMPETSLKLSLFRSLSNSKIVVAMNDVFLFC